MCNLRFDDTNPDTEDDEYVEWIIDDSAGSGSTGRPLYASDYFEQLYEWAELLIQDGKAYVDDQTARRSPAARRIRQPGHREPVPQPRRRGEPRPVPRMRAGEFAEGAHVLRAKIDMQHENMQLRDPVMYRIRDEHHHRTGDAWKSIRPTTGPTGRAMRSRASRTRCARSSSTATGRSTTGTSSSCRCRRPPRQTEFARLGAHPHGHVQAQADGARRSTASSTGGTTRACRRCAACAAAAIRRRRSASSALHRGRPHEQPARDRVARIVRPQRAQPHRAAADGRAPSARVGRSRTGRPTPTAHRSSSSRDRQQPGERRRRLRSVPFIGRAVHRARRLHGDPPPKYFRLAPGREVRLRGGVLRDLHRLRRRRRRGQRHEVYVHVRPRITGRQAPDGRKVKSTMHWVSAHTRVDGHGRAVRAAVHRRGAGRG